MIQPVRVPPDALASSDDEMPTEELSDAVLRQLLPRLRRFALRVFEPGAARAESPFYIYLLKPSNFCWISASTARTSTSPSPSDSESRIVVPAAVSG